MMKENAQESVLCNKINFYETISNLGHSWQVKDHFYFICFSEIIQVGCFFWCGFVFLERDLYGVNVGRS